MLIVDIPKSESCSEVIRLGVIGSCRVRDIFTDAYKTDTGSIESGKAQTSDKIWHRFSAFTHTPMQTLQYFQFITGEIDIPVYMQPLIFNRELDSKHPKRMETLTSELIDSIDMFVAEVCTLNEFYTNSYQINISYTERNFIRAGGKPLLKWWRSVTRQSDDHKAVVKETLDALPSKSIPDTEEVAELIRSMKQRTMTDEQLASSIERLKTRLSKPLLIVPIVNIPDAPAQDRSSLIDKLYSMSATVGFHFYDPTRVAVAAGQENAFSGNGVDTLHFEPGFHYSLFNDVVPFVQEAVSTHSDDGSYLAVKHRWDSNEIGSILRAA
ncbi:MAG: hypothetical protein AB8B84_12970 [Granulosicoccus sp.]